MCSRPDNDPAPRLVTRDAEGIHRPDVGNRFPTVTGSDYAGFLYNINTSKLSNGVHTIGVRLWDDEGASRLVGQRRVDLAERVKALALRQLDRPIREILEIDQPEAQCSGEGVDSGVAGNPPPPSPGSSMSRWVA